ncbi:MAG: hypothetical protein A3B11_01845 [Candidatus Taylorbacteria bacterium RIFCSPLOWO2_01_FULL_44_26]|uniref:Probable peptidoglycan glycosyltransferase FtsW n=2 Tax=Candidatus Tayloriibacteriota TaxID=1817919 RepID=A0A1G2ML89_9BACT|nr:MAG: hypothetical protein A3D50_02050 [Candidatus Taylorbacteria bacterium RIFCSPHIGHO2_02_FULL_44_12]OHA31416.1 MAG: hypothetical protein A3B11_01845 [Candidatus Taylorbacteria bacterium RIFCSPLOWO2_01_FULL_44_26]
MNNNHQNKKIDRFFLFMTFALAVSGFIIFLSASLGLLLKDSNGFEYTAIKQTISLGLGIIIFFVFSQIPYLVLKKHAFFIFIGAIAINILLFIPSLALNHGGATRWIDLGFVTFQPSEFLKIAFVLYMAAWIFYAKDRIGTFKYGLFPYLVIMAVLTAILLQQSDTDTLAIIGLTGILMLAIAGASIRHMVVAGLLMIGLIIGVIVFRPYALERVRTFFDHSADSQGSGYQINQSLIAIGSGQLTGRGFGQSIQKFGYLPQPTDDSIFAVAAEEFGFIGSVIVILLYLLFAISAFRIGARSKDIFGGLTASGIAILIISESFLNMAAMLGLIPLSGLPLLFVSHGGTALIITLAAAGIVANISKYGGSERSLVKS